MPALAALALAGCETVPTSTELLVFETDFNTGADGWVVEFADYPVGEEEVMELRSGIRNLPAPLDTSTRGMLVAGANRSDDLFMYMKKRIDGLVPGMEYRLHVEAEFATHAGSNCVGIGGAPGESVWVKAGATGTEPGRLVQDGWYRMNIDKGQQATGGQDMAVIDDVANGSQECVDTQYRKKVVDSSRNTTASPAPSNDLRARADQNGRLWIVIGTDSGFEGTTALYYTYVRVTLER